MASLSSWSLDRYRVDFSSSNSARSRSSLVRCAYAYSINPYWTSAGTRDASYLALSSSLSIPSRRVSSRSLALSNLSISFWRPAMSLPFSSFSAFNLRFWRSNYCHSRCNVSASLRCSLRAASNSCLFTKPSLIPRARSLLSAISASRSLLYYSDLVRSWNTSAWRFHTSSFF